MASVSVTMCLFVVYFWGLISLCCASKLSVSRQKLEVQKHLKRLNKPPVKTIKSEDGDIIDCVHISQQPAFDHPFLKDHKIQMRPSYHPEGLYDDNKVSGRTKESTTQVDQLWQKNGSCPENTIPIRRTKKEDLLRASSVKLYGKKMHRSIPMSASADSDPNNANDHKHAVAYVQGDKYYGAGATINVWQPKVSGPSEFSSSQIWILGGSSDQGLNIIEAGWQVNPGLYGDNNTRLFTYWTDDAYVATGCYNLMCSGFIQTNTEIAVGATITPASVYLNSQYEISILVWKDVNNGYWWMQFGNGDPLGYWPSNLFSNLADSASMIQWGGEVVNLKPDCDHTTTQMGSGRFPHEGFGSASYFRNIQVVDVFNSLKDPEKNELGNFTEQPNCFQVQRNIDDHWGHFLYYGGPGGN